MGCYGIMRPNVNIIFDINSHYIAINLWPCARHMYITCTNHLVIIEAALVLIIIITPYGNFIMMVLTKQRYQ